MKQIPVIFGSHGLKLHGKIIFPQKASINEPVPGAVLCHGFGADQSVMESSAFLLAKNGVAAMVFDMRGHGFSEGNLDGNFYEDVVDAWQTLIKIPEIDSSRIALIGHSLGAFSAILATRKMMQPAAIVALSCPSEVDAAISRDPSHISFLFARRFVAFIGRLVIHFCHLRVKVDWKKFLESFVKIKLSPALGGLDKCAKLFIFGSRDTLTPFSRFAVLYDKIPGPKKKILINGSHVTPIEAEILRFEWIGWVVSALSGAA